ncbi:MAG: transglutaminase family protein [Fimbriimonas sp.]|nr:transglutaminase family protein [Fimbriimonas sp.]
MLLRAIHRTVYRYPVPSTDSHNEVRLQPLDDEWQTCREFHLRVAPWTKVYSYGEPGGLVHHFGLRSPHPTLEIVGEAVVETHLENPFEGLNFLQPDFDFYSREVVRHGYAEFLGESPYVVLNEEVHKIADLVLKESNGTAADFLRRLTDWIYRTLEYDTDVTHVHSKLHEILAIRAGVCQDFAHLMIACCRIVGIPSRYVSGYLLVHGEDGLRGDHATHAWIDCLMPDDRWLSLDPTNNLLANDRYIRIHTGRDYSDVTPTRGVYIGLPASDLAVSVRVDIVDALSPIS